MKIKFYLFPLILFLSNRVLAQCGSLSVSYTASESRCVATGSVLVNVTGGSGNYTYKATGPVTTPATSSNNITGLGPGTYTIEVKDLVTGCVKQVPNVQITGNYEDPRFQLTKTDVTCANSDGTISVINQQYGRAPFTYSIIAPSPSGVGTTNSTGVFTGLVGGEYSIQLQDSCGGIQVRKITVETYSWWFDDVDVTIVDCDRVKVTIRISDNKGNENTSGDAFSGFQYGYVIDGDTIWGGDPEFEVVMGSHKTLTILVMDPCGQIQNYVWNFPPSLKPSLGNVKLSDMGCSTFTASVTGTNLSDPQYCLTNENGDEVACNESGIFTNIPYGKYCIEARDNCYDTVIVRCFNMPKPQPAVAASVSISNRNCSTFTARITGQQNLFSPTYCLLDNNGVQITCNSTGTFNNVPYGSYCITTRDACTDSVITRCFTVSRLTPTLNTPNITGVTCSTFNVSIGGGNLISPTYCLYDSDGQLIGCNTNGVFTGQPHGSYCIRAITCGDTLTRCFTTSRPVPSMGNPTISDRRCDMFMVSIGGQQNLTNPTFCIYNSNDSLLKCNSTGTFDSLPYGSYCIRMTNTCFDTVITRCFNVDRPIPSLNATMQVLNKTCDKVSIKVNGTNLYEARYILFDSLNQLLTWNMTGVFNNIPYGYYCVRVDMNCYDTTMFVCQNFVPDKGITLSSTRPCSIGNSYVDVTFANNSGPFNVKVYHPNGSLVLDTIATANPLRMLLPALPANTQYTVIGSDSCGNKDTAMITPIANLVTTNTSVRAKCPSATWLNGSGDILAGPTSNHYNVIPKIIRKNGNIFNKGYSSVSAGIYTFSDLEPAQYVVEYTQQTCNLKLYDTIVVPPYTYPAQGQSALYQCDNNGFTLNADVVGGVGPYTYQIIGSMPETPSIVTASQSSPVFTIDNGTVYSLVRLRTIDACGNATLSDVSVLPLQNISITASDSCFYQNIMLTVDTVPNATYLWYKKTTPTDSILLGSGLSYNLPFFMPEDIGQYVCKMIVNLGCVTRIARFNLYGCANAVLPAQFTLQGRKSGKTNQLFWSDPSPMGVMKYVVERKRASDDGFMQIGSVSVQADKGAYIFNDTEPGLGSNQYRLRIVYNNKEAFTNIVTLMSGEQQVLIYPNPVRDALKISISTSTAADYAVEIVNVSGQVVFRQSLRVQNTGTVHYARQANLQKGVYIVRVKNLTANTTEIRKLLFE